MSNNFYVIYYSNFCNNSKDLLKELGERSLLQNFEKICVDNINKLGIKLPNFLTDVPTILVPDYNKPLIGIDAFKWIKWKLRKMNKNEGDLNPYEDDGFSNAFSSLTDNDNHTSSNSNFTSLASNDKIIHQSQEELKSFSNSISNDMEQNFEKRIQDRNNINNSDTNSKQNINFNIQEQNSYSQQNQKSSVPDLPPELKSMQTQSNNNNFM